MLNNKLLEVKNLKKYYPVASGLFARHVGDIKAVDGISFDMKEGEILGLVGESGCGKTVTGLSLLRLVPEPAGRIMGGKIILDGEDLLQTSVKDMRRIRGSKISMILQDPMTSLNPSYNIGNQVGEAIRVHQKLRGNALGQKILEILRLVRIPAPESRVWDYPHQMSGGMRQRVTGAISLSCQPSLLIADEPTTSLDVTIQAQYMRLLKDIQRDTGVGLVFITHDFGIVAAMCHRVAVMYSGRIVETGPTEDIFDKPHHPYTKSLMGCLPDLETRSKSLTTITGQPPRLDDLPAGCYFAPRCLEADLECRKGYPAIKNVGDEHYVNCWHV